MIGWLKNNKLWAGLLGGLGSALGYMAATGVVSSWQRTFDRVRYVDTVKWQVKALRRQDSIFVEQIDLLKRSMVEPESSIDRLNSAKLDSLMNLLKNHDSWRSDGR